MKATLIVVAVCAGAALASCSEDHQGFYCPTSSFSSSACAQAVANASCQDGGTEGMPLADGGVRLCCSWIGCQKDPSKELGVQ